MGQAVVALASITLDTAKGSVTFSNIDQSFRDLILVVSQATQNDPYRQYRFRVNGDSGANYNQIRMYGTGSGASSSAENNSTEILIFNNGAGSALASMVTNFMDYSVSDKHKVLIHRADAPDAITLAEVARWANTSPITSITAYTPAGEFVVGSTFILYGVKA